MFSFLIMKTVETHASEAKSHAALMLPRWSLEVEVWAKATLWWTEANHNGEQSRVKQSSLCRDGALVSSSERKWKASNWSIKDTIMTKKKNQPRIDIFYESIKHQSTITKIWWFLGQNRYGYFTRPFWKVWLKPRERGWRRNYSNPFLFLGFFQRSLLLVWNFYFFIVLVCVLFS